MAEIEIEVEVEVLYSTPREEKLIRNCINLIRRQTERFKPDK